MAKQPDYVINEGRLRRRIAFVNDYTRADGTQYYDCWIWASTCKKKVLADGTIRLYPVLPVRQPDGGDKVVYARRFAWEMTFGSILPGFDIINLCGEQKCIRPHPDHNKPCEKGWWWVEKKATAPATTPRAPKKSKAATAFPSEEAFLKGSK